MNIVVSRRSVPDAAVSLFGSRASCNKSRGFTNTLSKESHFLYTLILSRFYTFLLLRSLRGRGRDVDIIYKENSGITENVENSLSDN